MAVQGNLRCYLQRGSGCWMGALLSLPPEQQPPSLDLCACSPSFPIQLEGEVGGGKEVDGPETREGWRISQPAQGRAFGSQRAAHTSPCGARH